MRRAIALAFALGAVGCGTGTHAQVTASTDVDAGDDGSRSHTSSQDDVWGDCKPRTWVAGKNVASYHFRPQLGSMEGLATVLPDGKVLIGQAGAIWDPDKDTYELLDQVEGDYLFFGTATILADKKTILFAGGARESYSGTRRAWLYDIEAKKQRRAADMIGARGGHAAMLLPDGRVLVVGGAGPHDVADPPAEYYDPKTNTWTRAGMPKEWIADPGQVDLVRLPDGSFVMATNGGYIVRYWPEGDTWRLVFRHKCCAWSFGVGLADGRALFAMNESERRQGESFLFDPMDESFTRIPGVAPAFTLSQHNPKAVLLPCGQVLALGQLWFNDVNVPTWLFDPRRMRWSQLTNAPSDILEHARAQLLPDGRVLVTHGQVASSDRLRAFPLLFVETP